MPWTTTAEVADALGIPVLDDSMLNTCTAAANAWAFRRRQKAGYVDDPDIDPGPDVAYGTTLYAVALYRERGSADSFASFDAFQAGITPIGGFGQVNRLLGIPRPQVDSAATDELVFRSRSLSASMRRFW